MRWVRLKGCGAGAQGREGVLDLLQHVPGLGAALSVRVQVRDELDLLGVRDQKVQAVEPVLR